MTKSKSMNFIIPLVVYPFDVMVSFGETNEQVDKTLNKYNLTAEDVQLVTLTSSTVQGRTAMFSSNQTMIRLRNVPSSAKDYGNLQHEIFHAASFVMDRIGMILKIQESDEAWAYLIGYLTTEIYKRLW